MDAVVDWFAALDWPVVISLLIGAAGLILGIVNHNQNTDRDAFQRRSNEEAAETQRRLLQIEETRHSWEQKARGLEESKERETAEDARSATFVVRFGFRDSARGWARIIATNTGPAVARDVELEVWGEREGKRVPVGLIAGEDSRAASELVPGESVHLGIAFTIGFAGAEELRYKVSWDDDRGAQKKEGLAMASY
jgi:hypothetical protein